MRSLRWLTILIVLYLLWLATRSRSPSGLRTPFVEDYSLTAILPINQTTLPGLDGLLEPFLVATSILHEVAIVCPRVLMADVHSMLLNTLSNAPYGHPKVSLYPWSGLTHHQASLGIVTQIKTEWVLLLDEHGLHRVSECERAYLLHPRAVFLPVGPRGFMGSSELSSSDRVQPVTYLVPPFVAPSSLLAGTPFASPSSPVWPMLGNYIAKSTHSTFGGLLMGSDILNATACDNTTNFTVIDVEPANQEDAPVDLGSLSISSKGLFVLAFPLEDDLRNFIPGACKLYRQGYTLLAYLYDTNDQAEISEDALGKECTIRYLQHRKEISSFSYWLSSLASVPDILIGLESHDPVSSTLPLIFEGSPFLNTTLIRLPRPELPYTEWIGTLTLHELRHWNVPEVTLAVITNNRPESLTRLLESIRRTLFYGDKVDIRINMDQTSDPGTMRIVQIFDWPYGDVFLHHRVIHGGLLPAVVESWYPHCDDSYGLLLEDDVELSSLSYAWVKMSLLRYKYGRSNTSSSKLFGISLYQQKTIELRPTGRQLFNAHALFGTLPLTDPSTPYLSQIPCSWGALYFPAPWREFHDYLTLRLSEHVLPIQRAIVPRVRSNRWTRSWKRYFIELVYLRGYVMLYPNYDAFVSLSTNHLEVGSHVRDEPGEVYEKKKRLFSLPLMTLAGALPGETKDVDNRPTRLLDLPGGELPDWDRLPVLDLMGEIVSLEAIQNRADERKADMSECQDVGSIPPSVQDLLCQVSV